MKLLFIGNCTFRDDTDSRVCNPFKPLRGEMRDADAIIMTLRGNITKKKDLSEVQSVGEQLVSLKRLVPNVPIIVDYKNEDLFTGNKNGKNDTLKFLTKHGFIYTSQVIRPLLYGTLCIFSCIEDRLADRNTTNYSVPIELDVPNQITLSYISYIKSYVLPLRTVIVNLRIKPYSGIRLPTRALTFSKLLIECGVDIVHIHASRSKPLDICKSYKNGIIICGLGELINCRPPRRRFGPITSDLCTVNTVSKYFVSRSVDKKTVNDCVIPKSLGKQRHGIHPY